MNLKKKTREDIIVTNYNEWAVGRVQRITSPIIIGINLT